ncbi:type 2 lantipeptide synthetase LanM family protein [Burkholderiaceae bacterium DAT-1]|nr:type 2 lantipeptide synthetase LanM family protein [Burkholderiaceae bacterium DAT-1]
MNTHTSRHPFSLFETTEPVPASETSAPAAQSHPSINELATLLGNSVYSLDYTTSLNNRSQHLAAYNERMLAQLACAQPSKWLDRLAGDALQMCVAKLIDRLGMPAVSTLREQCVQQARQTQLIDPDYLASCMAAALLQAGCSQLGHVLAFEINIAAQSGLIRTDSEQHQLGDYAHQLQDARYIGYLIKKYPVMMMRLATRLQAIGESMLRLIQRAHADRHELAGMLQADPATLQISALKPGAGDHHNGGDTVTILEWRAAGVPCGTLVYKPRSLDCEQAFAGLIDWLNSKQGDSELRLLAAPCLTRPAYGWMGFIKPTPVPDTDPPERYFRRYGALMAIMDCLSATDMHFENVITSAGYPVAIDLETILQPLHVVTTQERATPVSMLNVDDIANSIYFTAMVDPVQYHASREGSPLAGPVQQPANEWQLVYDPIKRTFALSPKAIVTLTAHCPMQHEARLLASAHADAIVDGFKRTYALILANKQSLITQVLPRLFADCTIRLLFKPTGRYGSIIQSSHRPYCLQSLANMDEFLCKLMPSRAEKRALQSAFQHEYEACLGGDIPYFYARAHQTDIHACTGPLTDIRLTQSGLQRTLARLLGYTQTDIDTAAHCIAYALHARVIDAQAPAKSYTSSPSSADPMAMDVDTILDVLDRRILFDGEDLLTVDLTLGKDMSTGYRRLDHHLYLGLPGVLLAMSAGAHRRPGLREKTDLFARHYFNQLDPEAFDKVGACVGLAGPAYLAQHLARATQQSYYLDLAAQYVHYTAQRAYMDRHFDVFSGSAGALLVAASLHAIYPDQQVYRDLVRLADNLLTHADARGNTLSWKSSTPSAGPTTGYAHGMAGIGSALIRAYRQTGSERYLNAALSIHRFIQQHRLPDGRWAEDDSPRPAHIEAWCHGAPGIGLFYLDLLDMTQDKSYVDELAHAVDIMISSPPADNDSLCHGTLGNLDLLISLTTRTHLPKAAIEACLADRTQVIRQSPIRCGNKQNHYSFSLFTGISGMAYQLMRLDNPDAFPSLLTFDI